MTRLTSDEIEAIRKRAELATEGPWKKEESRYEGQWNVTSVNEMHDLSACLCRPNDAEFIANAREDIPKLLAEVERLRNDMSEIAEIVADFYTEQGGIRLPSHLTPIAGEISVIHKIALGGGK